MTFFSMHISKISKFFSLLKKSVTWMRCWPPIPPSIYGSIGEDVVIEHHLYYLGLDTKKVGAYLDIGGYHPVYLSNTFRFYGRATGFVVDVGESKHKLWRKLRPSDTFIKKAIVPNNCLDEKVTFVKNSNYGTGLDHVEGYGHEPTTESQHLTTNPLQIEVDVLRAEDLGKLVLSDNRWHVAAWRVLSIDIEGLDYEVLRDIGIEELRPDVIAAEDHVPDTISESGILEWYTTNSKIVDLLKAKGYALVSVVGPTLIFVRIDSKIH